MKYILLAMGALAAVIMIALTRRDELSDGDVFVGHASAPASITPGKNDSIELEPLTNTTGRKVTVVDSEEGLEARQPDVLSLPDEVVEALEGFPAREVVMQMPFMKEALSYGKEPTDWEELPDGRIIYLWGRYDQSGQRHGSWLRRSPESTFSVQCYDRGNLTGKAAALYGDKSLRAYYPITDDDGGVDGFGYKWGKGGLKTEIVSYSGNVPRGLHIKFGADGKYSSHTWSEER